MLALVLRIHKIKRVCKAIIFNKPFITFAVEVYYLLATTGASIIFKKMYFHENIKKKRFGKTRSRMFFHIAANNGLLKFLLFKTILHCSAKDKGHKFFFSPSRVFREYWKRIRAYILKNKNRINGNNKQRCV